MKRLHRLKISNKVIHAQQQHPHCVASVIDLGQGGGFLASSSLPKKTPDYKCCILRSSYAHGNQFGLLEQARWTWVKYTTGRSGQHVAGALDGCRTNFLWLCKDHPMDGTLKTLKWTFWNKPSIGWFSGKANLKKITSKLGLNPQPACLSVMQYYNPYQVDYIRFRGSPP
ncbi:hypothetical protein PGTUg99_028257 [Puccinia graminis f. sp. tritici]|uniref:Uncharacterized protein n=1 Tax=Puccinia graminis f. sp. tritici TaxID=56615 RepID=A0A5B0RX57_PUCGR|nr:hypothetical protein PGTUg99_028257 [Puccinia graminis f. sp. tritici]